MKKIDAVLVENGGGPIHIGLNHKLAKICQGNWAAAEILELLEFFSNENSTHFNKALTVIVDYRLPPDASDATGLQVKEVFKKHIGEPEKWFATLRKIALNHHFVKDNFERSDAELLSELTELNQGNEKILELINSGEISALLEKIALHEKAGIKLWKAEDIRDWAKLNKEINVLDKLAEAMAVIKRASELAHGYTLRTIQVISTFLIYTSQQSRLIEVATGEGKSLITAAFTILKSLEGKRGDIITSSPVLAERDAESQKAFFELFGLSVDDNINNSKEDVKDKKPYENHVVYGDASSFMGDALRHDYLKLNTRGERKYDFVVIDEVDNMLIDKSSHIIRLSSTSPGFESLEQILLALWSYFRNIIPMHIYHDKVTGNYYFIEKGYEVKDGQLVLLGESNEAILISENIDEYYHKLLLSYGSKLLEEGRQKGVFFPPHLKDFVKQQIPNWVASLIKAEKMSENVHYVISEKEGERVISSLDVRNTGVVQSNLLWSNGLHQFLQIKHGLKLNAESIVSCFISNVAYLKKYEGNIYGVTGTLGRNPEKSILAETYNVDFVSIPTFKPKQFLELSAVIANSSPEWMQSIVASAVTEASLGRAVLIVAETIAKAKEIEKELLAAGLSGKNIKMYTRNDNAEKDVVNEKFNPGDVIVATNLAGRGTDLKLDPKIEENGGLHVCVTFLPANKRQGDQCYGRGGRQGNSGTGQLIIDLHQTIDQLSAAYPWFYGVTEEELIHWRDLADEERLLQDQTCERGMLDLRDELFRKFSELKDEIVSRPLSDSSLLQAKLIPLQKEMSSPISKAKSFEKIKEKYKRLLEQRNKDESPNISQLEELWKLWLHEHEADMLCHFKGKITSKGVDYNAYDQLRANMLAKFKEFRSKMLASYEDDSIMINPAYLIKRALIKSSEKDARRAAGLDDELAHAAYYAQARIVIDKDNSAKEQVVSLLIAASERIKNQIEILKSESILLNKPLGTNTTLSDLERQIIAKIGAYNKHIEQIEKNINQIKSNPDKYIRINSYTPLVNFLDDPNALSKEDVNEFYAIGMGDVFEITSYLPELDEGDWSCNVFAFFAGVVQIIAGVMVSAMSFGLASHIGAALIIEGVCDIFSSIKSAIDGKPMDFSSYFKSKGVSYAIDIITLGVLDIVGKIGLVKGPAVKIAESLEKITILSLGKVASAVGEKLSEAALLNFKEEIIESIKGSLNKLVNTDSKELQKIFASDAWDKQPSMQNKLFQEAYKIIEKYSRQLNDITQIFTGVAKKVAGHIVPGSNYAITAGEMAYNLDKISALVEEFCQRFSEKIKSLAGNIKSDNEKFQESLGRYFDSNVALEVHSIAVSYGLVSESIDYSFCEQIIPIDWGEFEKFENNIDQACRDVAKVSTSDYGPNLSFLKDNIAASLSNNMISRIQNQLFNPLLAMAEGQAGAKMYQTLQEMGVDVKNAVKDEARKSGEQVYQTTSDKPVHGLHLSNLESSDLSAKEKLELREYATALQAGKAAGIHEAGVAARALQRTIVVMVDGKEYKTWQEQMGGRNIYVNYNSQKGVWTTFAGKSMAIEFSSLYDAIACQLSGQTEKAVRDKMADYVTKYPYEALNYLHQYQTELRIKPYINFGQNYVRAKPIDTSQDSDNEVYVDAEAVKATKKPNNKQGRVKDSKIPELRQDSDKQPPYTSLQKPEEEDTVKAYSKDDKVEKKRKYFKEQHEKILKNYVSSSVKSMKKLEEDSPLLVIDLVYILHKAVKEKCVVSSKEQLYNLSPDAYEALAKVADELGSISSEMQSDFENLKNDVTGGWYNKLQEKLRQWSELYQDEVPEVVIDAIDYFAGQKNTKKH
jgi:preprotein translocase subunit SecA